MSKRRVLLLIVCAICVSSPPAHAELRDPTRPASARAPRSDAGVSPLRVEAIVRSDERKLAIVNGRIVRVGDHVSGARIDAILADGVRYTREGRSHEARLARRALDVRRPAALEEDVK